MREAALGGRASCAAACGARPAAGSADGAAEACTPQSSPAEADPLGEGFASTWRTRLIKVGARLVTSQGWVRVMVSSSWPFWDEYVRVSRAVLKFCGLLDDGDLAYDSG